jgi:hypothetical protein
VSAPTRGLRSAEQTGAPPLPAPNDQPIQSPDLPKALSYASRTRILYSNPSRNVSSSATDARGFHWISSLGRSPRRVSVGDLHGLWVRPTSHQFSRHVVGLESPPPTSDSRRVAAHPLESPAILDPLPMLEHGNGFRRERVLERREAKHISALCVRFQLPKEPHSGSVDGDAGEAIPNPLHLFCMNSRPYPLG